MENHDKDNNSIIRREDSPLSIRSSSILDRGLQQSAEPIARNEIEERYYIMLWEPDGFPAYGHYRWGKPSRSEWNWIDPEDLADLEILFEILDNDLYDLDDEKVETLIPIMIISTLVDLIQDKTAFSFTGQPLEDSYSLYRVEGKRLSEAELEKLNTTIGTTDFFTASFLISSCYKWQKGLHKVTKNIKPLYKVGDWTIPNLMKFISQELNKAYQLLKSDPEYPPYREILEAIQLVKDIDFDPRIEQTREDTASSYFDYMYKDSDEKGIDSRRKWIGLKGRLDSLSQELVTDERRPLLLAAKKMLATRSYVDIIEALGDIRASIAWNRVGVSLGIDYTDLPVGEAGDKFLLKQDALERKRQALELSAFLEEN